jgi:hypothetical protein
METPQHGALNLIRIIGVMLVVVTLLELAFYWAQCVYHKPRPLPVEKIPVLIRLVPALLGFIVIFKARAIAAWIEEMLDL